MRIYFMLLVCLTLGSCASAGVLTLHAMQERKPPATEDEAKAICLPQAKNVADIAGAKQAAAIQARNARVTGMQCQNVANTTNCQLEQNDPGNPYTAAAQGMLDAQSISDAKESAGRAELATCLAGYGYTFTVEKSK